MLVRYKRKPTFIYYIRVAYTLSKSKERSDCIMCISMLIYFLIFKLNTYIALKVIIWMPSESRMTFWSRGLVVTRASKSRTLSDMETKAFVLKSLFYLNVCILRIGWHEKIKLNLAVLYLPSLSLDNKFGDWERRLASLPLSP